MQKIYFIILTAFLFSCSETKEVKMEDKESIAPYYMVNNKKIDIQGHRGGRGLWPENSTYGFLKATDLKVTTLEMDVVVSKDNHVVVSHDHVFNPEICKSKYDNRLESVEESAIYKLDYSEIKEYDCGSSPHSRFPNQEKVATYKPLLKDVIREASARCDENKQAQVFYNIEIKSRPEYDGSLQPETPEEYVKLVLDTLTPLLDYSRFTIQSFDTRILEAIEKYDSKVRLVYLVEETELSLDFLDNLSFSPEVISPDFNLLNEELIKAYQEKGLKVIPWTVNESSDMKRMLAWGVDGIISDYPDRLIEVVKE